MRRRPILAVDLGGTNIRMGRVNSRGEVLARKRVKMPVVETGKRCTKPSQSGLHRS